MRNLLKFLCLFISIFLISCDNNYSVHNPKVPQSNQFHPLESEPINLKFSQTVYVPIYSSIIAHNMKQLVHLTSILSIRNVSADYEIIVSHIDYYDTNGNLLKKFIDKSFILGKMSSKDFLIPHTDISGGSGANFIVKWKATHKITAPIIESINIGIMGNQGFSFSSRGRVVRESK